MVRRERRDRLPADLGADHLRRPDRDADDATDPDAHARADDAAVSRTDVAALARTYLRDLATDIGAYIITNKRTDDVADAATYTSPCARTF